MTALADALRALHRRGHAAWPDIELDMPTFAAAAARTVDQGRPEDVRAEELYLAIACAANIRRAVPALDRHYILPVGLALVRRGHDPAAAADVLQTVRERFLVGTPDAPPRIADFDGRGSLATWIHVAAYRAAISANRKVSREVLVDDFEIAAAARSPELDILHRRFGQEFEAAFRRSFAALSARERNLLRLQFIDGLGIDRIAAIYGVHRATAARRLAQARHALREGVRWSLQERLRVDAAELDSLFNLVDSRLELSLRLFTTPSPSESPGGGSSAERIAALAPASLAGPRSLS